MEDEDEEEKTKEKKKEEEEKSKPETNKKKNQKKKEKHVNFMPCEIPGGRTKIWWVTFNDLLCCLRPPPP